MAKQPTVPTGFGGLVLGMLERARLVTCVLLALASTAIWWALVAAPWVTTAPFSEVPLSLVVMWSTGGVYSVLVLSRYVSSIGRAGILAGAGVFTYWLGYHIAYTPVPWTEINTALAGSITAAFLGYVTARLGRLHLSWRLFAMLAAAGAIGGAVIGWSIEVDQLFAPLPDPPAPPPVPGAPHAMTADDGYNPTWYIAGHGIWQVLTCMALYFSPQDRPAASDEG